MTVMYGPIQLIAIGFDNAKAKPEVKKQLLELSKKNLIRILDISYVSRSIQDTIRVVKGTELDDVDRMEFGAAIGALLGFGAAGEEGAEVGMELGVEKYADKKLGASKEDLKAFAESLPKGSAVALLLIEHLWFKDFKSSVRDAGGSLISETFITPEAIVGLGMDLGAMANAIEEGKILEAETTDVE